MSLLANVQAVLFDLDGTLIDSAPDLGAADALADGGFALDPRRRGEGSVQVLGQTYALADGRAAMDALLHRLALHPATARHVSRKLAQRFVGDTPPAALVERMAQAYVQSGGRLSPALWVMLASPAFADSLLKQRVRWTYGTLQAIAKHYKARMDTPWRDLPECYGYWHTIYLRFKRGAERGLWWNILFQLQQARKLRMAVVMADSTTIPLHRHGGASKGGSTAKASVAAASRRSSTSR